MGRIARWISGKIDNYIIGVVQARFGYNTTARLFGPSGDDSPPLPQDKVLLVKKDGSGNWVASGTLVVSQGAAAGEKILYSRDANGSTQAKAHLKADGTVVFNDGTSNAARNGDSIASTAADDPTFWTWLAAAAVVLAGLGVVAPTPTSLSGKITSGTSEVKLP